MVVPRGKFDSTNQKHYPDLGSDESSVWSFCARFSDVIWRGKTVVVSLSVRCFLRLPCKVIRIPGRVVQYCRPESGRILLLSIGKPEVSWCKVLPSVWMHWTRIDSDGKVHFLFVRDLEKFCSCWMSGWKVIPLESIGSVGHE